jgi:hypothetical protein
MVDSISNLQSVGWNDRISSCKCYWTPAQAASSDESVAQENPQDSVEKRDTVLSVPTDGNAAQEDRMVRRILQYPLLPRLTWIDYTLPRSQVSKRCSIQ